MDLNDPLPDFLSQLDSNREAALSGFKRFAELLFEQAPPPNYLRVPIDDREDIVSEVVLHCIADDCAKLRKFTPRSGTRFKGWLAVVASRKISDLMKQQRRRNTLVSVGLEDTKEDNQSPPGPEEIAVKKELETIFLAALRNIGRRCRLLLRLKILEYKNREIVELLRLPKTQNKKIGNQVIECRKKLIGFLRRRKFFEVARTESG